MQKWPCFWHNLWRLTMIYESAFVAAAAFPIISFKISQFLNLCIVDNKLFGKNL
jgi:hypothetical protein